jgi:hypothetical protein
MVLALYWGNGDSSQEQVTCTADVYVGSLRIGSATATAPITVWCPYYACGYTTDGTVNLVANPGPIIMAGLPGIAGITWKAKCVPQDLFGTRGIGKWAFIQMELPGRSYTTTDAVTHVWSINGLLGLDTSYPYPFWEDFPNQSVVSLDDSTYGKPDDDVQHKSSDSPDHGTDDTEAVVDINEQFWTYMVYFPPPNGVGTVWVPLHRIAWQWNTHAVKPNAGWMTAPPPSVVGTLTVTEDQRCKTHPLWNRVLSASARYVP